MANFTLIRDLCETQKITIRELAQTIGRNESSIQAAIRKGSTNTATLEAIAKALRVQPGYFFDGWQDNTTLKDLTVENEHLRTLLNEKERTIEILLSDRNLKIAEKPTQNNHNK